MRYYTLKQLCTLEGVSKDAVKNWARRCGITFVKIDRSFAVSEAEYNRHKNKFHK